MKIAIDSTYLQIDDRATGKKIVNMYGRYNDRLFHQLLEKVLTPAQFERYIGGGHDYVFDLSAKREKLLFELIKPIEGKI